MTTFETRPAPIMALLVLPVLTIADPAPAIAQAVPGDTAAVEERACRVLGRVLDTQNGEPVVNASLWLETDDEIFLAGAGSSRDGSFVIETPACETAVLRVRAIGYVEAIQRIPFDAENQTRQVTIRLEPDPIAVEELRVEIPRSLRLRDVGFYARKAWEESTGEDLGQFYDPEEVEGRAASGASVLGIAMIARIRSIYGGCAPSYYIDGIWFRSVPRAMRMLTYGLRPKDVEGVEIYRAIYGAVPEEFRDPNSNTCGAVVVWTKVGKPGEAPPIEVELCEASDDPGAISFGGVVTDELTGVVLPAAYITMTTVGTDVDADDPTEIRTVSDESGVYRYCDLEEWPATLQAQYGSVLAEAFEVDPGRATPGYWAVDLKVAVVRAGILVGVVVGESVDPTVTNVVLEGTDRTARPTERGYFEIGGLLPGDYVLIVRRGEAELLRREVAIRSGAREVLTLDLDVPEG
ncbi:MAG: carboxypeptidase regulatory-like domain-containing protein [Gemmatimonadota bacterium]